jgi:hypothetical protein
VSVITPRNNYKQLKIDMLFHLLVTLMPAHPWPAVVYSSFITAAVTVIIGSAPQTPEADTMPIDPNTITAKLLREECSHGAYERGSNYFSQGRVSRIEVAQSDENHVHLSATIRGSGRNTYDQEIDITEELFGLCINGGCSCPVGYNCKHVVAACLSYKAHQRRAQGKMGDTDAFGRWLDHFVDNGNIHSGPAEILLYSLIPQPPGGEITVNFTNARRKRDGSLGKGRSTSLSRLTNHYSSPSYIQAIDDEIISLLEAATGYSWGTTKLNGATGNPVLLMLAESGRAYWGDGRKLPLHKGMAREANLIWREIGNALRLDLEAAEGLVIAPVFPPLYIDPTSGEVGLLTLPEGVDSRLLAALAEAPAVPRSGRSASAICWR